MIQRFLHGIPDRMMWGCLSNFMRLYLSACQISDRISISFCDAKTGFLCLFWIAYLESCLVNFELESMQDKVTLRRSVYIWIDR